MSAASSRSISVEIRARVSGYLEKMHFSDGQIVKQGDLLFTIDKRPFENTLAQARGNAGAGAGQSGVRRKPISPRAAQLVRDRTITEQTFEQRTQAKRAPQARSPPTRRRCARPSSISQFTELRAPVAGRIGDRRVSPGNLVTGGHRRATQRCSPPSSRSTRSASSSPSMRPRILRYERLVARKRQGRHRPRRRRRWSSLKLIDESDFTPSRQDGFRRQRDRPRLGHDPRPRGVGQSRRRVHAGHVRPRARAGLAALSGAAAARRRDRLRAGAQVRAGGRTATTPRAEIRHARPARRATCASSRTGIGRTTASSSTA